MNVQEMNLEEIVNRIHELRSAQRSGVEIDREELVELMEREDELFW